jgi:hypothetical protein
MTVLVKRSELFYKKYFNFIYQIFYHDYMIIYELCIWKNTIKVVLELSYFSQPITSKGHDSNTSYH